MAITTMIDRGHHSSFREEEPDTEDWPHGEMVDLAKEGDAREEMLASSSPVSGPSGPNYPYGLAISLTDDELEKLGLDGDPPEVGDVLEAYISAKVMSCTCTQDSSGEKTCRIELQITHMLPHEFESEETDRMEEEQARGEARRNRFYDRNGVPDWLDEED